MFTIGRIHQKVCGSRCMQKWKRARANLRYRSETLLLVARDIARLMEKAEMPATLTRLEVPTDAELDAMSDAELLEVFRSLAGLSVKALEAAAAVWQRTKLRGCPIDLKPFHALIRYAIPLIADGRLAPEVVTAFPTKRQHRLAVAALPVEEQRELANGKPVELVVKAAEGVTKRLMPVEVLTEPQLKQVFNPDEKRLRTEQEQIAIVETAYIPTVPRKVMSAGRVSVDRAEGLVKIGTNSAPIADVVEALRKIGFQISEARTR